METDSSTRPLFGSVSIASFSRDNLSGVSAFSSVFAFSCEFSFSALFALLLRLNVFRRLDRKSPVPEIDNP